MDVPRFELGASSMPRKRASKLRHTPSEVATCDGHLRRMERETTWTEQGKTQLALTSLHYPMNC